MNYNNHFVGANTGHRGGCVFRRIRTCSSTVRVCGEGYRRKVGLHRPNIYCYSRRNGEASSDQVGVLNGWRTFWTAVDTGAWLGALGTAAAFVATQEALLIAGPVILPIIALYASKEKSSIDAKKSQVRVEQQFVSAVRQLVALSEEGTAEMAEEVASALSALEESKGGNVSGLEEMVRKLEKSVEQGDEKLLMTMKRSTDAVGEGLKKLRGDVREDLQGATREEVAALARLDSRIAALEGAISGLDSAQSENLRRLTASLSSSMSIEEDVIASAVKAEVWKSLEPVRQLPQILSQTLPRLSSSDSQSFDSGLTEDGVKKILSIELENLKNSILIEQQDMFDEFSEVSTKIDSSQWNQLGAKLEELDEKIRLLGEDTKDMDGGEASSAAILELKEEFGTISRELGSLGSQIVSLQKDVSSSSGRAMLPEEIRSQLQETVQARLKSMQNNGAIDEGAIDKFSEEIVEVIIDIISRIVQTSDRIVRLADDSSDSDTGVPIASWLSDKEMENVPIQQVEQVVFSNNNSKLEASGREMEVTVPVVDSANIEDKTSPIVEEKVEKEDPPPPENEPSASEIYENGIELLKEGRRVFDGGDYSAADEILEQADVCFQQALEQNPEDIKAIGNRGNTLMARAKSKLMLSTMKFEEGIEGAEDDEEQAQEMLLQAGRLYRQILEVDQSQGKAFINWGRVICLRAEISQNVEDFQGAYSLFCNASDKFIAGIDTSLEPASEKEAYRLAGTALLGAHYCANALGLADDAYESLLDAESFLENALGSKNDTLTYSKLDECRDLIARSQM